MTNSFHDKVAALAEQERDRLLAEIDAIHRQIEEINAFVDLLKPSRARTSERQEPRKDGELMRDVLHVLDSERWTTTREVGEKLGVIPQNVQRALKRLHEAGRIERSGREQATPYGTFSWRKVAVVREVKAKQVVWP